MLQPLQLQEVSVRCHGEIAELRDFLKKTGEAVNTSGSFGAVAARVRADRAFSRDLTSHLWVFLHARDKQLSYSDLLGMLAIASGGPAFAASADEADAHSLLRFLMDVRSAFDLHVVKPAVPRVMVLPTSTLRPRSVALPTSIAQQPQTAIPPTATAIRPLLREQEDEPPSFRMSEGDGAHLPLVWFAVAGCLFVIVLGGIWLFHSSTTHSHPLTAETAPIATSSPLAVGLSRSPAPQRNESMAPGRNSSLGRRSASGQPNQSKPQTSLVASSLSASPSPPAPVSNSTPSTPPLAMAKAPTSAIPNYPRLLRRSSSASSGSNLAPPVVKVSTLGASGESIPARSVVQKATVRATSLGTMAANVTYSPAPTYPTAASALHVQGQVKLEAEVDPNGSVVSTRIISGPPLLQAAAADAVQQWRYRPYLYNDKPIGMNTTVVMDFQLP